MNRKQVIQEHGPTCVQCGRKSAPISVTVNGQPLNGNQLAFRSSEHRIKKVDIDVPLVFCTSACLHEWVEKFIGDD